MKTAKSLWEAKQWEGGLLRLCGYASSHRAARAAAWCSCGYCAGESSGYVPLFWRTRTGIREYRKGGTAAYRATGDSNRTREQHARATRVVYVALCVVTSPCQRCCSVRLQSVKNGRIAEKWE